MNQTIARAKLDGRALGIPVHENQIIPVKFEMAVSAKTVKTGGCSNDTSGDPGQSLFDSTHLELKSKKRMSPTGAGCHGACP